MKGVDVCCGKIIINKILGGKMLNIHYFDTIIRNLVAKLWA